MESAANPARQLIGLLDRRDWEGVRALLTDDAAVTMVHDGRTFTRDEYVAFNAEYPGRWSLTAEDVVATHDRAVVRARVFDDELVFHLASFLTVRDGSIARIVEVWTDGASTAQE